VNKFKEELSIRLIAFIAWSAAQIIGHTCRFKVTGFDRVQELVKSGQGFVMAIWHGRTLLPVYYCRGMGIWAITSLSRDGEIQTRIVSRFGYQIIRGSTYRGAIRAALTAAKRLDQGGVLAITPDGPTGPYHEVQEGIVFLARRANCPIIPIGVGIRQRKILPVWDKYAFPMPFAKVALIFGEPLYLSEDSDPAPSEIVKNALNNLEHQAKAIVKEGL
jgi:lysophospholipid acyltransferase (LPLAT)-like uncharacterized protein